MSGTKYPSNVDDNTSLPLTTDLVTPVKAEIVNNLRSAILAIENELGVDPSAVYATVRARLDALAIAVSQQGSTIGGLSPNQVVITSLIGSLTTAPLINQQYAVLGENPLGTLGFFRLTSDMILPSFTVTMAGGQNVEVGQTIITPAFTSTYNRTPISATLTDNNGSPSKDISGTPNSYSSNATITKNTVNASVIFTNTASDGNASKTASTTYNWYQKNYFGVGTAGQTTAGFILGLTGVLSPVLANTFSTTAGPSQKIYFACRAAYATATFTIGGFSGGFNLVSNTISVTNGHGFTENYALYESTNLGLGTTSVVVT